MARPKKQTVDYFPHFVKSGRTIFILESRFGNNGYAFWYKLLEVLGESEGHFYDCSNPSNWAFLLAKVRLPESEVNDIIDVLIELGKIDKDLWSQTKILWVSNFVNNLSEVYRTRHSELPVKPLLNEIKDNPDDLIEKEKINAEDNSEEKQSQFDQSLDHVSADIIDEVMKAWNDKCGNKLPQISTIHSERKNKIISCIKEIDKKNKEDINVWFNKLFSKVAASSFLTGDKGWKASFDWVLEKQNWVKILEGNFDDKKNENRRKGTEVTATSAKDFECSF